MPTEGAVFKKRVDSAMKTVGAIRAFIIIITQTGETTDRPLGGGGYLSHGVYSDRDTDAVTHITTTYVRYGYCGLAV